MGEGEVVAMTLIDFMAQAGFWQWVGCLCALAIIVQGLVAIACALARKEPPRD